jgi:hypothetical protein
MDVYHIFFDLRPGVRDLSVCAAVDAFLARLRDEGRIVSFRILRRKLGLGPRELGEFHVIVETHDLAQLDQAFRSVSTRSGVVEELHAVVNQQVEGVTFALYRDFPDPHRETGEERF